MSNRLIPVQSDEPKKPSSTTTPPSSGVKSGAKNQYNFRKISTLSKNYQSSTSGSSGSGAGVGAAYFKATPSTQLTQKMLFKNAPVN